jgi:hypothetical protein
MNPAPPVTRMVMREIDEKLPARARDGSAL